MIISYELLTKLVDLQKEIANISKNHTATNEQVEHFLCKLELDRAAILKEIKIYNETIKDENNKIDYIDNRYRAYKEYDQLKIYIPEVMPKYKNIARATYKRIMLNIADVTKPFKDMFDNQVLVYIKMYDNQPIWDLDNKTIKPICDGLILSDVIKDDNYRHVIFCIRGFYSDIPHTEITISDAEIFQDFLEKYS